MLIKWRSLCTSSFLKIRKKPSSAYLKIQSTMSKLSSLIIFSFVASFFFYGLVSNKHRFVCLTIDFVPANNFGSSYSVLTVYAYMYTLGQALWAGLYPDSLKKKKKNAWDKLFYKHHAFLPLFSFALLN